MSKEEANMDKLTIRPIYVNEISNITSLPFLDF